MYKTGDRFVIEIEEEFTPKTGTRLRSNTPDKLYRVKGFNSLVFDEYGLDKLVKSSDDEAYKRGLNDAWETARRIGGIGEDAIPCKDLQRLFGVDSPCYIFRDVWAFDAMQTVRKYVEKTRDEIKVGDEVLFPLVGEPFKAVVMDETDEDGVWYIYSENGCVERMAERLFKRTGRHFPQIAEVLKQMQEDE